MKYDQFFVKTMQNYEKNVDFVRVYGKSCIFAAEKV